MPQRKHLALDAHSGQRVPATQALAERCRSLVAWDTLEIDQARADRLILQALSDALDGADELLCDEVGP